MTNADQTDHAATPEDRADGPDGAADENLASGAATEPASGEPVDAEAPSGTARSPEQLAADLAVAERARDEYLDFLRRERAEFENFRKRTTRERMDALDRGAEALCTELLGVLDNFGFAMDAADKSEDDQLAKGVQMVHGQLVEVLARAGLEQVPGVGQEFDPTLHEAVLQVEAADALGEDVDDPMVVEVMRPGYRFKGRVLRPAAVKVAR